MTPQAPTGLRRRLTPVFETLAAHFGPQGWWRSADGFEVIAGALLVQNTAWPNAQAALDNLAAVGALSIQGVLRLDEATLQDLVRPSGYYRQKALKLRVFAAYVQDMYGGSLDAMLDRPLDELRAELLALWGVGAETADTILLYAARQPSYVVDRYTARILARLGVVPEGITHDRLRTWLMQAIAPDVERYAEQHALLVRHGKTFCRTTPDCPECPLLGICRYGSGVVLL